MRNHRKSRRKSIASEAAHVQRHIGVHGDCYEHLSDRRKLGCGQQHDSVTVGLLASTSISYNGSTVSFATDNLTSSGKP